MTTAKKAAANKRNAQSSTGPVSPAGKAIVAANALKHGLLAQAVVVSASDHAESQPEFDAVLADFLADLQPVGAIEETLVERIATCYWRMRRAQRFETSALESAGQSADAPAESVDNLRREIKRVEAQQTQKQRMADLLARPAESLTPEESAERKAHLDEFDRGIGASIKDLGIDRTARDVLETELEHGAKEIDDLKSRIREATAEQSQGRVRQTLEAFLPDDRNLINVVRYESMLDRQFHRALIELHRLRSGSSCGFGPRRHLAQSPEDAPKPE